MLNVVLIDDEEPALQEMEFLLRQYPEIHITGSYTNSLEALERIEQLKPDAIFIDINMPQLSGMELVKKLHDNRLDMDVIFVTAYEKYAVEAFRVEAMDYLLKPVIKEQLDQTVERLIQRKGCSIPSKERVLELKTMGQLQIQWSSSDPMKWRTEKEKELFAFLLNSRGSELSRDRILDALWGEYEADRAVHQLYNAIYYIKKTLTEYGIGQEQINITGRYSLRLGKVWYDRDFIEQKMATLGQTTEISELETILEVFTGGYHQYEGWTWAEQERETLRQLELKLLMLLSERYQEIGLHEKAELMLSRAFRNNPLEEMISYRFLELYHDTGEYAKMIRHYKKYQEILKEELGIAPQKRVTDLYHMAIDRGL